VRAIYRDIERALGVPFAPAGWRALAAWPGALEALWSDARDALGRAEYRAAEEQLRAHLDETAARVGLGRALDRATIRLAGLGAPELANLSALIHLVHRLLVGQCVQTAMLARAVAG
jgi:hypothetical protein